MTVGDRPYRHLLSLGYNCAAAYQIRLHTGTGEKHFFDWLYTSVDAVIRLIASDFSGFMEKSNLEIQRDAREVFDRASGIRFNHSFKNAEGKVSQALMDGNYEAERDKFLYLAAKFRIALADEEPVGFIRYNPYPDRPDAAGGIDQLANVLRIARQGRPFHLFWIVNAASDSRSRIDDGLSRIEMAEDPSLSSSYHGHDFLNTDDVRWGALLASLPLDLKGKKRPGGEPVFSF